MRKAWKRWFGAVVVALVTSGALAQGPDHTATPFNHDEPASYFLEEGSVRLGQNSGPTRDTSIRQSQYVPSVDEEDVVEDMINGSFQPRTKNGSEFSNDDNPLFASTERTNDILFRVGNQSLDAYGYNGGYTNLNAFVPVISDGARNILFVNPRVNITDYGQFGANLGVGYRTYSPSNDRVYGVSGWWDLDNGHRTDFQQWGMNVESLGRWISLRGGFALPIGQDHYIYHKSDLWDAQFVGNNIVATRTNFFQQSYSNYNAEIATPLPGLARYGFDVGLGMYALQGNGVSNIIGGSLRTQAQVTEDVWLNGTYTYDPQFKSQFSLNVEITMPDGSPKKRFRRKSVQSSLTNSVIRNYRIAVTDEVNYSLETLTDSGGGTRGDGSGSGIKVVFIDANATSSGDGSRSTPFQSLSDYMALPAADRDQSEIIYIRGFTDGSQTNLNSGLPPLDTQKVLGDSVLPNGRR